MLASTGLGSCIVLAVVIGYLIYLAVPAKKKPAVAAAGQDNQIGDPMSEIQATTLMAGVR